jgi:photoactive yellow protein
MRTVTLDHQIFGMSEADLDAFPLGIIRLDASAKITYYNQAQETFSQRSARTCMGLNFFRDVAPCAAVKEFQGKFDDFVQTPGNRIEPFEFVFRFSWGQRKVTITFVKRGGADENVYIVVNSLVFDASGLDAADPSSVRTAGSRS